MIIPFAGDRVEAARVVARFAHLRLKPGDETIVGDNSRDQVFAGLDLPDRWAVAPALGEGSPARARNAGAAAAGGEWLLFIDSDCVPAPDVAERHLARALPERCGLVAGRVDPLAGQPGLAAGYAASRRMLDQRWHVRGGEWDWAFTANLLVRRAVWEELGGFLEGIRNGEDVDFCWRARRAGWDLSYNHDAAVEHEHRDTFRGLWRQAVIAGASSHWVHRRWPDAPRPRRRVPATLARAAAGTGWFLVTGRPTRALYKLWDGVLALAWLPGWLRSNRPRPGPGPPGERVLALEEYPAAGQQAEVARLAASPGGVRVVARRRPARPELSVPRVPAIWLEDDTPLERAAAAIRVRTRRRRP